VRWFLKRFAVVSDIHSNLDALLAVLDDFDEAQVEKVYCLGDLVGYGAHPLEVIDIAMQDFEWVLRGNHDDAVTYKIPKYFNQTAAQAVYWTRDRLKPKKYSRPHAVERWEFMRKKLRDKEVVGDMAFGHGTLDSYFKYVDSAKHAAQVFESMSNKTKILFIGHTHIPGVWEKTPTGMNYYKFSDENLPQLRNNPLIINVGSIGQPRDGDTRACYLVVEGDSIFYRRVSYDLDMAVKAVHRRVGLPNECGNRLRFGN
jgi:predicted phosphodiesterase